MRAGHDLNKITITGLIPGKQHQMIIAFLSGGMRSFSILCDIHLTPDDRPDAGFLG